MAKECSTPVGTVEGGKGKGKSGGKGKGLTGLWNNKGGDWKGEKGVWKGGTYSTGKSGGGGKGYQGTCWNCGKVGHKANEGKCGGGKGLVAEVGEEQGSFTGAVSTGGVWTISAVEAEGKGEILESRKGDEVMGSMFWQSVEELEEEKKGWRRNFSKRDEF